MNACDQDIIEGTPGRHWQMLSDGRVQCDICPRECRLHEGQRGLCFVRARHDDAIVLTTYGRSSGFCIDPIEKKPLNHFLPGTPVLSFGTAGCNLTCKFCQHWDISKSREMDRLMDQAPPELIAVAAQRHGCRSVAYTYNDPVIFHEYAIDVAAACRDRNIRSVAVSAGYVKEAARAEFYGAMDAANIDLKAFTEGFYRKLCTATLGAVVETLKYIAQETDVWLEITTLLIPGENDSEAEIEALTQWVFENLGPDVPLHFTAFHPDYRMLDKPATPARNGDPRLAHRAQERHSPCLYRQYLAQGNRQHLLPKLRAAPDRPRLARAIADWRLTQAGHCARCGTHCAGVFEEKPGNWGRKRQPIRLGGDSARVVH